MDISHFETKLEFAEETRAITPAQAVIQRISTAKDISKLERPHEPGVRIRDERLKLVLLWTYDDCSILYEDPSDYKQALSRTISLLENINEVAPIGKIKLRRLRIYWTRPVTNYDFKSLEHKYRGRFINESKIFDGCFDSSVIMEMKIGNFNLYHQSGIMDISQLQKDFRAFKMEGVRSKVFIFLSTTASSTDVVEYSGKSFEEFLLNSFEICRTHSDGFEKIVEEVI